MYAGKIVEYTDVERIFDDPRHPYTRGLLASIPRIGVTQQRLSAIPGTVPDAAYFPSGCRFHPRCPIAEEQCRQEEPPLLEIAHGHKVACWKT
jgi:peptide/nickel transport system ATP-binding protein/oligopeptide transport system ATP-binding protein